FLTIIRNLSISEDSLTRLLRLVARFIREATLRSKSWTSVDRDILDYYMAPTSSLLDEERLEADYLAVSLPSSLLEEQLSRIEGAEKSADSTRKSILDAAAEFEDRIKGHQAELARLATEFNFVGLASAFKLLI